MALNLAGAPRTVDVEDAGRRITLLDEAGQPYMDGDKPVTALVAGSLSKRVQKAFKQYEARVKSLGEQMTDDDRDQAMVERWVPAVIAWDLEIDGDPAVAKIFDMKPLVYNQIVSASVDHAGFFGAPSTNSSRT